jgi:hypothetical protein
MPRTVKQVDKDLTEVVTMLRVCRAELAKRTISATERSTLTVRESLMHERIERLLDERSQLRLLAELAAL